MCSDIAAFSEKSYWARAAARRGSKQGALRIRERVAPYTHRPAQIMDAAAFRPPRIPIRTPAVAATDDGLAPEPAAVVEPQG
jgi:hypothetical protein